MKQLFNKPGLIPFVSVWLAIFLLCSVLSGVAYSIEQNNSVKAQTTNKSPDQNKPSSTPSADKPETTPSDADTPYDELTYSADNARYLIYLDAGHGWYDNGASVKVNEEGIFDENGEYVYEKNINLELTKKLKKALEKMGYSVGETRPGDNQEDCPVELVNGIFYAKDRPSYVNSQNADYFISIHCNSFEDETVSGTRVFYSDNRATNTSLAMSITSTLTAQMGEEATARLDPQLYILLYSAMPTVLIESGFITNQDDLNQLLDPDWQDQFVCAIAKGLDAEIHSGN